MKQSAALDPPHRQTNPGSQPAETSFASRLRRFAFQPIDHASFSFFRIAFGVLMFAEVCRYFKHDWIETYWIDPKFLFTYYGFSWVKPWPGNWMSVHWLVLGVLASFITIGFLYRVSALLFFLGITYCFLLDQATYLNHMYLICLLSFLLIFVPAERAWSIDSQIGLARPAPTIPAWALWLFRIQLGIVYFYGGIAKISHDWLRGEPMRLWVTGQSDLPIIGRFANETWLPYFLSYGGLLLDLLIAPLLLWRRTRLFAFGLAVLFHILNAHMFRIGIFPWLGVAVTTLFLSPSWPRRVFPLLGFSLPPASGPAELWPSYAKQRVVLGLLGLYLLIQVLVPFRHYLYPGDVNWTYEGHRFSWRMKLHDRTSCAEFHVIDPNINQTYVIKPRRYLRAAQAAKMAARPDMILQFAHYLAEVTPRAGPAPLRVEARILCSINGRKPEFLVDPTVDLAAQPRTLKHVDWLMPRHEPLPAMMTRIREKDICGSMDHSSSSE